MITDNEIYIYTPPSLTSIAYHIIFLIIKVTLQPYIGVGTFTCLGGTLPPKAI